MSVYHSYTQTVADGTATSVVRPSDWNSAHAVGYALSGNTNGSSTVGGADVTFVGGNGLTLSADTAASKLVWSVGNYLTTAMQSNAATISNINVSAGTTSNNLSAFVLSNSNGLAFGLNGSTITGSYTVPTQTAQSAIKAFGVSNTGQTAGNTGVSTGVDWVLAGSQSITMSQSTAAGGPNTVWVQHPAWLTTAMQSNAATISNINVSAGTTSNNLSALTFSNANGISFGLNASTLTASYTVPTVTNSSFSVQDSATTLNPVARIAFSTGNNITLTLSTGASSATVGVAHNLAGTSTGFGGNLISGSATLNSSGLNLSLNHPAWLTSQSNQALSAGNGSFTFQTASFADSNGVSWSTGTQGIFATVATTYRASNDAIGLNTAQSNVTWTVNSSGLSLDGRGYAGTGLTFNVTNLSTSATLNSNGLNLSINNVDDHVKGFGLTGNTAGTTNTTYTTTTAQYFSGGPNITLSGNSNTIVISGAPAGGTTFYTGSYFANQPLVQATTTMTFSGSTLHMVSFSIQQNMSIDFLRVLVTGSVLAASSTAATTGNTSYGGGSTKSHNLVLYTRGVGANSMSLQNYGSTQRVENAAWTISANANSTQFSYSLRYTLNSNSGVVGFTKDYSSSAASLNFHTSQLTDLTGLKQYEIPFATALTPGQYWLGYQILTSVSTARTADESRWGLAYSTYGVTAPQLSFGVLGAASNSHFGLMPMVGSITTNATTTTASFPMTNITSSSNNAVMFIQGMRIT